MIYESTANPGWLSKGRFWLLMEGFDPFQPIPSDESIT